MKTRKQTARPATSPKAADAGTRAKEDTGEYAKPHADRIAEAAYFRAQRRDFQPGGELEDWLEAEKEINRDFRED
jgi:hypothetical protein